MEAIASKTADVEKDVLKGRTLNLFVY